MKRLLVFVGTTVLTFAVLWVAVLFYSTLWTLGDRPRSTAAASRDQSCLVPINDRPNVNIEITGPTAMTICAAVRSRTTSTRWALPDGVPICSTIRNGTQIVIKAQSYVTESERAKLCGALYTS